MRLFRIIVPLLACLAVLSCRKEEEKDDGYKEKTALIFYGAGYNNLSSDIGENISTILDGPVPFLGSRKSLYIYSHLSRTDFDFSTPAAGYLFRVYRNVHGVRCDTLLTVDASRTASDPAVLTEVLEFVRAECPDAHYGLILSSHGTGWLPAGDYYGGYKNVIQYRKGPRDRDGLPLYRYNEGSDGPKVKTFGAEVKLVGSVNYSQEMSVPSLAAAIPMYLDYIIFDACLMGGVEVAYELKEKAGKVAFSPTEVLAAGFDYSNIKNQLLVDGSTPEPFCEAYFNLYDRKSGSSRSATISVVDTKGLDGLAAVCRDLVRDHRPGINALNEESGVQPCFRYSYSWYYDLADIFAKAGISQAEAERLNAALERCISYKAATPEFLLGSGGFEITTYSGLSMFLPSMGNSPSARLFYRDLEWNKAIDLVE